MLLLPALEGEVGDQQHSQLPPHPAADKWSWPMTTVILAVIGGAALILTAAARIPLALAEFLRACIAVAIAARDLRSAISGRATRDDSSD
jgi:hypothetical protein